MYSRLQPWLFRLDPERAHAVTISLMRLVGMLPPLGALVRSWFISPSKPVQAFDLTFSNPVGLAAGYDKDGLAWRGLASLGFGHIEIGTVTLRPQAGNPKPRLFRLPEDRALINRMGFPGRGAQSVVRRLQGRKPPGLVLGVNLGKNKDTPLEAASLDYLALMKIFAPWSDYLAINVSSPNTVGLRRLQGRQALEDLLSVLVQEGRKLQNELARPLPLLVKLAPDLSDDELDDALDVTTRLQIDGLIVTNTTITRPGLVGSQALEVGGLSGAPLHALSLRRVSQVHQRTGGRLPVIGVGGVMGWQDARAMLDAGACLLQIYTGLVYRGPGLVKEILTELF